MAVTLRTYLNNKIKSKGSTLAKEKAKAEQALQLKKAADEIEQMKRKAELELKKNVVDLAVLASEKILDANIDKKANEQLLNNLVEDLKA